MTNKQQQEVEFLSLFANITPTEDEIKEYIEHTVHGSKGIKSEFGKSATNSLFQAKRSLDMNIKMWREGIVEGIMNPMFEFEPDVEDAKWAKHPFFRDKILPVLKAWFTADNSNWTKHVLEFAKRENFI